VNGLLHDTARGRMVSEWAKKRECWEGMLEHTWSAPNPDIPEVGGARLRAVR